MSKTTVERRAHRRIRAEFDMHGSPEQGGAVARMVAQNLSLGGLMCTSTADFPEMTRLAVRLLLPVGGHGSETEPIDLEAVVVRREEAQPTAAGEPRFELSLFFTRVDGRVKQRLASFIGD